MNVESLRDTNNSLCVSYIIDLPEALLYLFFNHFWYIIIMYKTSFIWIKSFV